MHSPCGSKFRNIKSPGEFVMCVDECPITQMSCTTMHVDVQTGTHTQTHKVQIRSVDLANTGSSCCLSAIGAFHSLRVVAGVSVTFLTAFLLAQQVGPWEQTVLQPSTFPSIPKRLGLNSGGRCGTYTFQNPFSLTSWECSRVLRGVTVAGT